MTRHFLKLPDFTRDELIAVLDRADELKRVRGTALHPKPLAGKTVAIVLEKASTRTRVSFEIGVQELGGHPMVINAKDSQLGRGEPLEDTARLFSRYLHAFVYRTFGHDRLETLAAHSTIPIINALSDDHHPCQLLADLQTVRNVFGRLEGLRVTWVGDGNNMAHCWIDAAGIFGFDLTLACPVGYTPSEIVLARGRATGRAKITVTQDIDAAVLGAHVVTTDVWASMGQEGEAAARKQAFEGYIVSEKRMAMADAKAIFLHCLPAHRGEEVEAAVIDGPASRVWDEAENRLHAQKALLEFLMTGAH